MKKHYLTTILAVLIGVLWYQLYDSHKDGKLYKESLKQSRILIDSLEAKNAFLHLKNDSIKEIYLADSLKLVDLKKENKKIEQQSAYYSGKYKELLSVTLKDCPDSLKNYQQRETVLLSENESVKESNSNLRDQVSNLEVSLVNVKLERDNLAEINANNDHIKAEMQKSIDILESRNKSLKKQGNKKFVIGAALGLLSGIIFL